MYIDGEEVRELKSGIIVPIIKSKKVEAVSDLRPVSLLSCVMKILERLIKFSLECTITALSNLVTDIQGSKCNAVCFTRHRISDHVQVKLANDLFIVSNVVKYLGMWLDSKLTWRAHVSETTKKCQKAINVLRVISKVSFGVDLHTSRLIYRATVYITWFTSIGVKEKLTASFSIFHRYCPFDNKSCKAQDLFIHTLPWKAIIHKPAIFFLKFPDDLHMNGARSKVGVGWAFIIPEMQYSEGFALPKEASAFTAEVTAIRKAMETILGMDMDNCANFSDSQREMLLLDYSLRQHGKTVTYIWIKGHANIRFNEEVDRLAKAACKNIDSAENLLLPHSDLLNEIKNRSYKDW
ncbi:hypothetical protein Trydic_g6681 [Trypoxylus dichotomus]